MAAKAELKPKPTTKLTSPTMVVAAQTGLVDAVIVLAEEATQEVMAGREGSEVVEAVDLSKGTPADY